MTKSSNSPGKPACGLLDRLGGGPLVAVAASTTFDGLGVLSDGPVAEVPASGGRGVGLPVVVMTGAS